MKHKIYTILFLILCILPIALIPVFGVAQPAANETLAQAPSLTEPDGSFNKDVLEDTTDYIGDRFALRQEMITLQRRMYAALFHESAEDSVILGKDNWLFYTETLDDYEQTNTLSERQLWSGAHTLGLIQEYCEEKGASFLFTVVPNKSTLYPEQMPDRYPRGTGDSNLTLMASALQEQGVNYCDLYSVLSGADHTLYRQYDSHWTQEGAGLAGDSLLAALGKDVTPFYGSSVTEVKEETGDLYAMLYPTGTEKDTDVQYDRGFTFTYASPLRSVEDMTIRTENTAADGSLLMFRDSFGNALHLFMAEGYGTATFSRSNPYNLALLDSEVPDTVVIELVERNLNWLNERAPIMPAPQRILEESAEAGGGAVTASVQDTGELGGYVTVSGELGDLAPDDDSPIYLMAGETVWEATPAGSGDQPFTAYIPSETDTGSMSVLFYQDGLLKQYSINMINQ